MMDFWVPKMTQQSLRVLVASISLFLLSLFFRPLFLGNGTPSKRFTPFSKNKQH